MADDDLKNISTDIRGKPQTQGEDYVTENHEDSSSVGDEEAVSGSASLPGTDDDTERMVDEVTGNPPKPGKPFSIAEEVAKDEEDLRGGVFDTKDVEDSINQGSNGDSPPPPKIYSETDDTPPDDKQ